MEEEIGSEGALSVDCFDSICRTCLCDLKDSMAFNISDVVVQKHEGATEITEMFPISEILSKCTSIAINTEDNLPKKLCQQCLNDLTRTYEFIGKCQKSEETLQTTLLKSSENIIVIKTEKIEDSLPETENKAAEAKPVTKKTIKRKPLTTPFCNYCNLLFETADELRWHRKTVKHPRVKRHECPQCQKKFFSPSEVTEHLRVHTKERPYSCDLCAATFNNRSNLIRHGLVHSGEKPFSCEHCSKAFAKKEALKIHIRTHTGETPYICNHCGNAFKQASTLKAHIQSRHSPTSKPRTYSKDHIYSRTDSAYVCTVCKRRLSTKQALKTHEERAHNNQRFLCSLCGGRYASKYSLEIHYRTHTNEKPFKCDFCGKGFKQEGGLRSHIYIHTGETPYSCDWCEKRFRQVAHLKTHVRTQHKKERPYQCKFCEKTFGMRAVLRVHERIHTGERPYQCDVCGRGFYDASSRRRHMMVHVKKTSEEVGEEEEEQMGESEEGEGGEQNDF